MSRIAARASLQLGLEGIFLMGSGYASTLLLAWGLGPEDFGLYGVIITLLVWIERTLSLGVPGAATKLIAEGQRFVASTSLILNLVLIAAVIILLWLLAPSLARIFQAPDQAWLFRLAAFDMSFYGFYLLYRGVAMGHGRFGRVLCSGVILASAKLIAVIWIVLAGYAIAGALVAYIIGSFAGMAFLIFAVPIRLARLDRGVARTVLLLSMPLALSNVGVSIAHNLDLWLLKALAAPDLSHDIGVYAATRTLARTPELVLLPIGSVLFPLISKSLAENRFGEAQGYVRGALRVLWLAVLPAVALIGMDAEPIVRLLFPAAYNGGGIYLSFQFAGFSLLTVLVVLLSILKARGDFYTSVFIGLGMVVFLLLVGLAVIPTYGTIGAAWSFVATAAAGTVVSGVLVYRSLGVLLSWPCFFNGWIVTGVLVLADFALEVHGLWLIPKYAGLGCVYALVLWLLGELRREDLQPLLIWR